MIDMKIAPLADVKARLSAYVDYLDTKGPVDYAEREAGRGLVGAPLRGRAGDLPQPLAT